MFSTVMDSCRKREQGRGLVRSRCNLGSRGEAVRAGLAKKMNLSKEEGKSREGHSRQKEQRPQRWQCTCRSEKQRRDQVVGGKIMGGGGELRTRADEGAGSGRPL